MKKLPRMIVSSGMALLCGLFASCAGRIDSTALTPASSSASHRTGQPILAVVSGGNPSSEVLANVSNEAFKAALESSLVKSGMFKSVSTGGYQIEAFITSVEQPLAGISMEVKMEVSYALKKGGDVIWRKSIKSSYTAPLGEALVGAVRVRKATEGAARENINLLIRALNERRP